MSYRPPVVSNKPFGGVSKIMLSPEKDKIKVAMTRFRKDGDQSVEYVEEFRLLASNCPKNVLKTSSEDKYFVRLSSDVGAAHREMLNLYPADGKFKFTFKEIWARDDEPPTPTTYPTPWENDLVAFNATVKFVDPPFAPEEVILWKMHFNFAMGQNQETGEYVLGYSKALSGQWKSKHSVHLDNFLTAIGYWDDGPREYKDNPLPEIDSVGKQKKLVWEAQLNDGKIIEIFPPKPIDQVDATTEKWEEWDNATPTPEFVETSTSDEVNLEDPDAWE